MKKIIFALAFLLVSNTAFAAWTCTKVSTENKGDTLDVTMSCTDGVSNPIVITRPVFRPQTKLDVRTAIRNVAIETKDRVNAIQRVVDLKAVVDADSSISAKDTDAV